MKTYILKRKSFSQYDETDRLKQMKDSDILAEKKKSAPGYGNVAAQAAGGALVGAAALGTAKFFKPYTTKKVPIFGAKTQLSRGASFAKGAKTGAILGGVALGISALSKRSKEAKKNEFYNDRLEYAQRQAQRREKADWKANMTQRDGYSY